MTTQRPRLAAVTPRVLGAVRARPALARTFAAFEHRDFRIFYTGHVVSVTGTWMQSVAQGWLVLLLTGSPLWLGIAAAARSLPVLILGFVGGIAADRFEKRRILLVANGLALAASVALAVLTATGRIDILGVLVLTFLLGVTNAFEMPARQSFVVELTGPKNLANAIALNSLLFNVARVVGPAIAGLIVAAFGPAAAFGINALTFVPVLVALWLVRPSAAETTATRFRGAFGETWAYLRSEPRVSSVLFLLAASTIVASGHFYLGPALAQDLGQGAEGLGLLLSATGVGAIVAGIVMAATGGRTSRGGPTLAVAGLVLAAAEVAIAFSGSFALTLVLFGVIGWAMVSYNVRANTGLQTLVPDTLRGRVMSLYTLTLLGLMPFGGLLLGAIADVTSSATAIGIGGAVWAVTVLAVILVRPGLRDL